MHRLHQLLHLHVTPHAPDVSPPRPHRRVLSACQANADVFSAIGRLDTLYSRTRLRLGPTLRGLFDTLTPEALLAR